MKKGLTVWVIGFLTFFAGLHTFDAVLSLALPSQTGALLKLYPFYGALLSSFGRIDPLTYFWISMLSTFALFGVTSSVPSTTP